jgi:peptidoglycan/LPS O-acetylase OafA/YrhL
MKRVNHYYPELDSLRFFAFLLVLIHHSPYMKSIAFWQSLSRYGWMGVDLFLCLSAFLFARLLYVEYQEKGNINVGYFYLRRVLRIWPLYFFFFAFMLTVSIQQEGWSAYLLQRSIGMLTFTDNIFTAFFNYNFAIWFSDHLWTISYEEQFYLIIPWVLGKFYRIKSITTAFILTGVMLIGMLVRGLFIYNQVEHPAIWVLPITHFEAIFGGLIVGLGLFDKSLKKIPGFILLTGGILALYWVTRLPDVDTIQWSLMLTYPLIGLGVTLILFAVMGGNLGPLSTLLKNRTLGYLGKISYGLYVYHVAGIWLAKQITSAFISPGRLLVYPLTVLLLALTITVLVSMLSYQFLERPFLRLKKRFTFIQSRPI